MDDEGRVTYPVVITSHFFHHKVTPAFVQIDLSHHRRAQVQFTNETREDFELHLPDSVFSMRSVPLPHDRKPVCVQVREDAPVGVYPYRVVAPRTELEAKGSSSPDVIIVR